MKSFYKRFDIFLKWLFIGTIIFSLIYLFLTYHLINQSPSIGIVIGFPVIIEMVLLFITLIFGIVYFIVGITLIIMGTKKKDKKTLYLGKEMVLKGLVRALSVSLIYFLLSVALSFFFITTSPPNIVLPTISPN